MVTMYRAYFFYTQLMQIYKLWLKMLIECQKFINDPDIELNAKFLYQEFHSKCIIYIYIAFFSGSQISEYPFV